MNSSVIRPLVAICILSLPSFQASAATVTLTPVADTSIFLAFPDKNLGANLSLAIGVIASDSATRGLVRFAPEVGMPPGARVTRAELQLNVVRSPILAEDGSFQVFKLQVPWTEGRGGAGPAIGTGSVALQGEATWDSRQHGINSWGAPGGQSGEDFAPTASARGFLVGNAPLVFESGAALIADVQSWIDQPGANHGWLIKDEVEGLGGTARRFASREDTTQAPTLTIEFESPLRITSTSMANNELCFHFSAKAGKSYQLLRREQVDQGPWVTVATLPPADADTGASLCDALNSAATGRFYRISEE